MRTLAPTLLLITASCGQGGGEPNQAMGPAHEAGAQIGAAAGATVTIAASGPEGCAATWNGQAVRVAELPDRTFALTRQAADAVGGIQNLELDDIPSVTVQAPAGLGFACADTILSAIHRGGAPNVMLQPPGRAPVPADFPLDTNAPPPPIPTVLGIGAGGQLTWNNDPLDAAGLDRELGRIGSTAPSGPGEMEAPPGGLELRVAREATFGQVYELLRTTRRYHLRPFVYLPSAEAAPPRPAAPVRPSGPPPVPPVPPPPLPPSG